MTENKGLIDVPCKFGFPANMCDGFSMKLQMLNSVDYNGNISSLKMVLDTYPNKNAEINTAKLVKDVEGALWIRIANEKGLVTDQISAKS